MHGGKSPNAQRSAKRRLLEAADPAAATLVDLLKDDDPHIRERAARAILDRAGYGPSSSVDVGDSVRGLTLAELKAKAREVLDIPDEEDPA
jgi:HEAT repeat protein